MSRDLLLLLEPGFTDPAHPGERFVCPHCIPLEGLLVSDPARATRLDVKHVPFARPRPAVIAALDDAHQGLPVLVLGDELPVPEDAKSLAGKHDGHGGHDGHDARNVHYVTDTKRILALLAERHGFPKVH